MNLQRACEMAIDIANHLIKTKKLGLRVLVDVIERRMRELLDFGNAAVKAVD